MAKGRSIVLTVECKGQRLEGTAAEVISPGMGVAITAATEPVGGRHSLDAAGTNSVGVADVDYLQGRTNSTNYAVGERVFAYTPLSGDELNLLFKASEGAQAIGDEVGFEAATGLLVSAGTGYIVMETITVGGSNTLVHVKKL